MVLSWLNKRIYLFKVILSFIIRDLPLFYSLRCSVGYPKRITIIVDGITYSLRLRLNWTSARTPNKYLFYKFKPRKGLQEQNNLLQNYKK